MTTLSSILKEEQTRFEIFSSIQKQLEKKYISEWHVYIEKDDLLFHFIDFLAYENTQNLTFNVFMSYFNKPTNEFPNGIFEGSIIKDWDTHHQVYFDELKFIIISGIDDFLNKRKLKINKDVVTLRIYEKNNHFYGEDFSIYKNNF